MSQIEEIVANAQHINGGWRIKTTETHHIDVLVMLFNDRIVTTPIGNPYEYDRYWCYSKGGAAFLAAAAWDGSIDSEPVGWKKAWGGRYPDKASHEDVG